MFKTDEIYGVYANQVGVKINNETARQQTPAFEAADQDRANALGDRLIDILFRNSETDTESAPSIEGKPAGRAAANYGRQKPATTTTVETTNKTRRHRPPAYHISRIQPR
jgi:hypothetical protein